ncbi:hypothetical protein AB0M28_19195 [Streptomyces sp. NPDC051940]|uniref:hypothetical protein n=1 Tax=Streptomyces sp. NPDC051940 TaxID=3155675 RepID=UPI003421DB62
MTEPTMGGSPSYEPAPHQAQPHQAQPYQPQPPAYAQQGPYPQQTQPGAYPPPPPGGTYGGQQPLWQPPAPPRPPRRALRAVLTWTAAVVVLAGVAGGVGYGITKAERNDLPLLSTKSDGRWDYPELKLPALPHGAPKPLEAGPNPAAVHYADLRKLLLPLPADGKEDPSVKIKDGWISSADFATVYAEDDRSTVRQALRDDAVRHIAARAWTMPDGTRTQIYLLQFNTGALADHYYDEVLSGGISAALELEAAPNTVLDESWPASARLDGVDLYVYDEEKPYGKTHARQAYVVAGDTIGLVVQEKADGAAKVPFQQTVILQHQLLG